MIVTVRQVCASGENRFQVEAEGKLLFQAQTPWADIRLPFRLENLRQMHFTDSQGRELFHTGYRVWDNVLQSLLRYQYLFGDSARLAEYQILDSSGAVQGSFYTRIDGAYTTQMVISYQDSLLDCYACGRGKIYVISIYDGERQIAQITKPLDTLDRLDLFYLHVVDDYQDMLPVLSFFTIYVDAQQFNRPGGAAVRSVEKAWSRTYNTNDSWYDPGWIARTFGQGAADQLDALVREQSEKVRKRPLIPAKTRKRMGILCGILAVILIAVISLTAFFLLRPKTAILPDAFAQQMRAAGYTVTEVSGQYGISEGESVYEAEKGGCSIRLETFSGEEEARQTFAAAERELKQLAAENYFQTSVAGRNNEKYTLTVGGSYYAVSRIGNTVVIGTAGESDRDEVKEILKELGY